MTSVRSNLYQPAPANVVRAEMMLRNVEEITDSSELYDYIKNKEYTYIGYVKDRCTNFIVFDSNKISNVTSKHPCIIFTEPMDIHLELDKNNLERPSIINNSISRAICFVYDDTIRNEIREKLVVTGTKKPGLYLRGYAGLDKVDVKVVPNTCIEYIIFDVSDKKYIAFSEPVDIDRKPDNLGLYSSTFRGTDKQVYEVDSYIEKYINPPSKGGIRYIKRTRSTRVKRNTKKNKNNRSHKRR